MNKPRRTYSVFQKISSVLMFLALCWLTVSLPFVFEIQQKLAKESTAASAQVPMNVIEEEIAPPGNAAEEKAPGSANSFSEEYMHDSNRSVYSFSLASQFHKCGNAGTYIAFHGELLSPPPEA